MIGAMKEKLASLRHTVKDQRSVEGEVVGSEEYYAWKGFVTRPTFSARELLVHVNALKACYALVHVACTGVCMYLQGLKRADDDECMDMPENSCFVC